MGLSKARWVGSAESVITRFGQRLEAVSETSCVYRNTDRLTGVLAPMVIRCFGGFMRRGFTDAGRGWKRYAEAKHARGNPGAARASS